MAAIAAGDVSYSIPARGMEVCAESSKRQVFASVTFGDGALTYPAGGIPLTKAKLGLPNQLESLLFVDSGSANGYVYKFDQANAKIRIYQGDNDNVADAPLIELGGSAAPAAVTLKVQARGY